MSNVKDKYAPYHAAVRYLENLGNIGGGYQKTSMSAHPKPQMFLERMQDFLDILGNPEDGFKYIHITGTAGKGSVAATVHNELVKAKKVAGLFTSPFTVSTIEKIQVGKKYIDPIVFAEITEKIKPKIDQMLKSGRHGAPSYFEMMFAIALLYFKRERCEYVVLEVGLGGRYDATNIIKKPLVTAITNIGLDHTNVLGSTRILIANDKAGIIKKGSQFFTTEKDDEILDIFEMTCNKVGARYCAIPISGCEYGESNRLLAGHICASLGIVNYPSDVRMTSVLSARFEIVEHDPLVIIDGAHNPSKLESTICNLKKLKYRNLILVIATSADKDWKTMIRMIAPFANTIYVTRFSVPGRQSVGPDLLLKEAEKVVKKSCRVKLFSDPELAFNQAKNLISKDDALLVVGSFYLAGDIRSLYCPEIQILTNRNSKIV